MEIVINSGSERKRPKYEDESLFNVYVIEYEDDSYNDEDPIGYDRALEDEIKKINLRPRTTREYQSSMQLWLRYREYLISLSGGNEDIFKLRIKSGDLKMPPKPKCKYKHVQKMVKKGIILSEPKYGRDEESINWDGVSALIRAKYPELHEPSTDDEHQSTGYWDEAVEVTSKKEINEIMYAYAEGLENDLKYKRRKRRTPMSDVDFMDEYFRYRQVTSGKKKKKKKKGKKHKKKDKLSYYHFDEVKRKRPKRTIEMFMNADLDAIKKREDAAMGIGGDEYLEDTAYGILTPITANENAIYEAMARGGWNVYEIMRKRKGTNKAVLKRYKLKKGKKKKKKNRPEDSGDFINIVIGDCGYDDYEQFRKDMEDGSWANVSKGGLGAPWDEDE